MDDACQIVADLAGRALGAAPLPKDREHATTYSSSSPDPINWSDVYAAELARRVKARISGRDLETVRVTARFKRNHDRHRRKSLTEWRLALRLESPQNFSEHMNTFGARSLSIALV
jgi:hypothetical protein